MFVLFILLFLSHQTAHCAEQDPVAVVKNFYRWYITLQEKMDPLKNKNIYTFVERNTVYELNKVRVGTPGFERDYFLKTTNPPQNMSGVSIFVNQLECIGTDIVVAVVEFKIQHRKFDLNKVIVVLKKTKFNTKIVKCIDVLPEA
ncbi:hypothetical protein JCM15519_22320 [Fundidesulfovibrio butyratiphilus]